MAKMNDESECRILPTVMSNLTNLATNVPVQEALLRSHHKRFEIVPEDNRVTEASEDASAHEKHYSWTMFGDDGFD